MKVAVVLMVRNEVDDVLAWLAWQLVLGVDTIIAFDDGSDDGTSELIAHASRVADIRLTRLALTDESFGDRQHAAYQRVLRDHAVEFDWIGFFDADEYLAIVRPGGLAAFLDRPADVAGVAINWCNYGSSGHVTKPATLPFAAYKHHYAPTHPVSRLCKSFVRPGCWTGRWVNVHYFDVAPHRVVHADGSEPEWSEHPGVTRHHVNWSVAKVMHFQCRSMAHFVERAERRDDVRLTTTEWLTHDLNEEYDGRAEAMLAPTVTRMLAMLLAPSDALRDVLLPRVAGEPVRQPGASPRRNSLLSSLLGRRSRPDHDGIATGSTATVPAILDLARLVGSDGNPIVLDDGIGLVAADLGSRAVFDLVAIRLRNAPEHVFLLGLGVDPRPIKLAGDRRITACPSFDVTAVAADNTLSLRVPGRRRHLCAEPSAVGGRVFADRHLIREWERFRLAPLTAGELLRVGEHRDLRFLHRLGETGDRPRFLADALNSDDATRTMALVPIALAMLSPDMAAAARAALGPVARHMC